MSINNQKRYTASRRDDLESVSYMLVYFLKGTLPWLNLEYKNKNDEDERRENIFKKKEETTPEMLCEGLPEEYLTFTKTVRNLGFDEEPNY